MEKTGTCYTIVNQSTIQNKIKSEFYWRKVMFYIEQLCTLKNFPIEV